MQKNLRNVCASFEKRMLHFGTGLVILAIVCGLALGQSDTKNADDSDSIFFPEPSSRSGERVVKETVRKTNLDDAMLSASLKIAQRMNSIESYEEFLEYVGVPPDKKIVLAGRFGSGEERSNAERPKQARCMPELQPVSLKLDNNPAKFYFPSCTRINRCGGCCTHGLLTCQPIASETRNFEVLVSEIGSDFQPTYTGREIVALEEHTKCKCACRIKPEHCTEKQNYEQDECRCVCTNKDEEEKCKSNNDIKLWDSELCTCLCREVQECSTGSYFDQNTCRCRQVPIFSRFDSISRRTGYKFGQTQKQESVPPVIVTLDASDPRRKHKDNPEY